MQLFAVNFILLQDHSTCFGCCPHPSSGVHKTVTTASSKGHIIVAVTFFQSGQVWTTIQTWPLWKKVAATIIWPVPEDLIKVLRTPDDECGQRPKHVQWSCSKIKLTANSCIFFQFLISNILITCSTPSSHRNFGLPSLLTPSGLVFNIFLEFYRYSFAPSARPMPIF